MQIAIIGAGLAGLACATALRARGQSVTVLDKGRGPGGRMSSRRETTQAGAFRFDHGAQYFTARDPAFQGEVARWSALGLAAPWPEAGPDAWVGTPSMNAPLRQLAQGLDTHWSARVTRIAHDVDSRQWHLEVEGLEEGPFDTLVVAVPAEQAMTLLEPWDSYLAARADFTPSQPCWTLMAAFAERLPIDADILRDDALTPGGAIDVAVRDSAKPGHAAGERWVVHATPDWSQRHLEQDPESVRDSLLGALAMAADIALPEPLFARAHRWRYARSGRARTSRLWNDAIRLGVCGDWLLGPRVESAWLSGTRLAEIMTAGL